MLERYEDEFEKAVQAGPTGLIEKLCVKGLRVCAPDGKSPALPHARSIRLSAFLISQTHLINLYLTNIEKYV